MRYFLVLSLAVLGQLAALADMGAIVKSERVNIRKAPSISADIIGQAAKDSKLVAVERHEIKSPRKGEPASWIKIRIPSEGAWIKNNYLDDKNQVKADLLNLRSTPSLEGKIVGRLKQGDTVKPLETKDEWTRIEGPEAFGFIAESFLTLTDKVDPSTPAPQVKPAPVAEAKPAEVKKADPAPVAAAVDIKPAEAKKVEPAPQPASDPLEEVDDQPEVVQVPDTKDADPVAPIAPAPAKEIVVPTAPAAPAAPKAIVPVSTNNESAESTQEPQVQILPSSQTVEPAATEQAVVEERIVRREGVVRPTGSPSAASPYGLYSIQNNRLLNFLHVTDEDIKMRKYSGKKVQVTGPESIDSRWPNHPLLNVRTIELLNRR